MRYLTLDEQNTFFWCPTYLEKNYMLVLNKGTFRFTQARNISTNLIFIIMVQVLTSNIDRTKLKQTELDCELLKRCCESLTDENRRLHKELHDLKALKLAAPLYMHLPPAATLAICPTCERISGTTASSEKAAKTPFAKPHFYNPFTNPSAAC